MASRNEALLPPNAITLKCKQSTLDDQSLIPIGLSKLVRVTICHCLPLSAKVYVASHLSRISRSLSCTTLLSCRQPDRQPFTLHSSPSRTSFIISLDWYYITASLLGALRAWTILLPPSAAIWLWLWPHVCMTYRYTWGSKEEWNPAQMVEKTYALQELGQRCCELWQHQMPEEKSCSYS